MKSFEYVKSTKEQVKRKSWNTYFMDMAVEVAQRSTCDRAFVGCVLVNERNRVIATGYNGSAGSGTAQCNEVGHTMRDNHCIATVHAEMNAICDCAYEGKSTKNSTAYITHFPCINCTKALIQAGVKKIYYKNDYRVDDFAVVLLNQNGIEYKKIE